MGEDTGFGGEVDEAVGWVDVFVVIHTESDVGEGQSGCVGVVKGESEEGGSEAHGRRE